MTVNTERCRWYGGVLVLSWVHSLAGPYWVGSLDTPGEALDIALEGQLAYVADDAGGMSIVDVSLFSDPKLLGRFVCEFAVQSVDAHNGVACLTTDGDDAGLVIVDVNKPGTPVELARISTGTPGSAQLRHVLVSHYNAPCEAELSDGIQPRRSP